MLAAVTFLTAAACQKQSDNLVDLPSPGVGEQPELHPASATVPPQFTETRIAETFRQATHMAIAPDGRIFVCEQPGVVRVVVNDVLQSTPFATINPAKIDATGSRGLMGIALSPTFATDRYLYLAYTNLSPLKNRIVRIRASATNPNVAEAGADGFLQTDTLLHFDLSNQVGTNKVHNSMAMRFAGNLLYVSTGDNGVPGNAQILNHSAGKILRMNADLTPATGNPHFSNTDPIQKRVWARGMRNPWTMAVNAAGDRLFVSDVGSFEGSGGTPNTDGIPREEINNVSLTAGDFDYGWPDSEGAGGNIIHTYRNGAGEDVLGSDCAVVGGTFYEPNTTAFPTTPKFPPMTYNGAYFFGDHCSGKIKYLPAGSQAVQTLSDDPPANSARTPTEFASDVIVGMVQLEASPNGALYYLTRAIVRPRDPNVNGILIKVTYTGNAVPETCNLTSPPNGGRYTAPAHVTLAADAADATGGGISKVEFFSTTSNIPGATQVKVGEDTTFPYSLDLSDLPQNAYRLVARCTNAQGGFKDANPITITVNGPTAVIDNPVSTLTYDAGDTINFSGSATDPEDGSIPASRFLWIIELGHGIGQGAHFHETTRIEGVTSGSYEVPNNEELDPNVFQRISLQVQDSAGIFHTVERDIFPNKTNVTVATNPAGLTVKVDGTDRVGGAPFVSVVGMARELGPPAYQQVLNGRLWNGISSWSNGGPASQIWIVPNGNPTITASFIDLGAVTGQDIGAVAAAGSYTGNGASITVRGSGVDVWGTADEFQFVHVPWTGDASITARVVSLQNTDPFAKAGVMLRDGTAAGALNAYMLITPTSANGFRFQRRTAVNGTTTRGSDVTTSINSPPNNWVRLTRYGNVFRSYHSADGQAWTQLGGDVSIPMASTIRAGLAVTSHLDGTVASAVFDNLRITAPPPPPPGPPTNLVCTPGNDQCTCSWTAPAGGAESYNLKRSVVSGMGHSAVVSNHGSTSYTDGTAFNGSTYHYVVSANNGSSEGPNSAQAQPCTPPPREPTNLIATGGAGQAQLSWIDNSSSEAGTKIERKLASDPDTSFAEVATVGANVVNYTNAPLAANTYTWRVRAFNAAGNSLYSNSHSATVTPATGPPPPSNLAVATSGSTVVNLTWSDNSTNEAGFRIERKLGTGAFSNLKTVAANSVSTTDNTATAGNTYTYRVIATGTPESAASNEAVAILANPVADAYVREGTNAGINYGTETFIKIKLNTTVNNNRRGYLRFSLAGVAPNVTSAKLRLYGVAVTNTKQIGAHAVSNITWGETTITFSNAPAMTSPAIQTRPVTTTAGYVEWDVTSYIQQQRAVNASAVSLGLLTTSSFPDTETNINSRENAANKPILIIGSRP